MAGAHQGWQCDLGFGLGSQEALAELMAVLNLNSVSKQAVLAGAQQQLLTPVRAGEFNI